MATTITTPDMTAAVKSMESDLASGLQALSSGSAGSPPASVPAPAPAPAPTPTPSAQPTAEPPQPGTSQEAPQPSTPSAPAPAPVSPADWASVIERIEDPAAKAYLEMHRGDLPKALAKALNDNNRLAALYKAHPEDFSRGGLADPKAPPVAPDQAQLFNEPAPAPPGAIPAIPPAGTADLKSGAEPVAEEPPPVQLNWQEINQEANNAVLTDATCSALVRDWTENAKEQNATEQRINELSRTLSYNEQLLRDESLGLNEVDKADRLAQLRDQKAELTLLRHERMIRAAEMKNQDLEFQGHRRQIVERIAAQKHELLQQQAQQQQYTADFNESLSDLMANWEPALARAAQNNNIPPDLFQRFANVAKIEAQARHASDPTFVIENYDRFLAPVAQQFVQDLDAYHRAQSANYAALAAQRATAPSPALPAGTPAPVAAAPEVLSAEDVTRRMENEFSERLRARR